MPSIKELRARAAAKQEHRCYYCEQPFTDERPPTADHLIPRALGGLSIATNIVAACAPCNNSKGCLWPEGVSPEGRVRAHEMHMRQFARKLPMKRYHDCHCEVPCSGLGPQRGTTEDPSEDDYP